METDDWCKITLTPPGAVTVALDGCMCLTECRVQVGSWVRYHIDLCGTFWERLVFILDVA